MGKDELRTAVLERRRARSPQELASAADAIAAHLLAAPFARVDLVAGYLSMATEPGTGPLLAGFHARGVDVIVPVTGPDHSLEWVRWTPDISTVASTIGVPEPAGERLDAATLAEAGLVVVPALAVDLAGNRLGRGAGYYDRALGNVHGLRCAVVFADELVQQVPHDAHDAPVDLVVTEGGIFRVPHPDDRVTSLGT
jgi:5-formyltetrahydrofolate cyclo-ligase